MRYYLLSLFLIISFTVPGQINVVNVNKIIPCCGFMDSLDIEGDGNYDIKYETMYIGSTSGIMAYTSDSVKTNGIYFYNYTPPSGSYIDTVLINIYFSSSWMNWGPGDGFRYLSFYRLTPSNDTLFGWIEMEMIGYSTINDSLKITKYASNTVINQTIPTGVTLLNGLGENQIQHNIRIYPNPADKFLNIESDIFPAQFFIYDLSGRIVMTGTIENSIQYFDISKLDFGLYIILINNGPNLIIEKK
ncbi:MAG: T9SS type A sorting domain-containing protein [Bacteroidota bacterium]